MKPVLWYQNIHWALCCTGKTKNPDILIPVILVVLCNSCSIIYECENLPEVYNSSEDFENFSELFHIFCGWEIVSATFGTPCSILPSCIIKIEKYETCPVILDVIQRKSVTQFPEQEMLNSFVRYLVDLICKEPLQPCSIWIGSQNKLSHDAVTFDLVLLVLKHIVPSLSESGNLT